MKLHDSPFQKKTRKEVSECVSSKFQWLNPSTIRDANGRRPDDPIYDKRTLYIPPDALKKMSASQKQYWSVKGQYTDVLLFFIVVAFRHSLSPSHGKEFACHPHLSLQHMACAFNPRRGNSSHRNDEELIFL